MGETPHKITVFSSCVPREPWSLCGLCLWKESIFNPFLTRVSSLALFAGLQRVVAAEEKPFPSFQLPKSQLESVSPIFSSHTPLSTPSFYHTHLALTLPSLSHTPPPERKEKRGNLQKHCRNSERKRVGGRARDQAQPG